MTFEKQGESGEDCTLYDGAALVENNAQSAVHNALDAAHDVQEQPILSWSHVGHKGNPLVFPWMLTREWNDRGWPKTRARWPLQKKWRTYATLCSICFIVGINATSIAPAVTEMNHHFRTSDEQFPVSYVPITSWTLGAAAFPLFILPLMEKYGFRWAYLTLYILFNIFIIPQALAKNFATIIITRFIGGGCAGVLQNAVDGVAADLWPDDRDRGWPVTWFILAFLAGPSFGPVLGGVIIKYLQWQWILYIELIVGAVFVIPLILFVAETRGSVLLLQHARALRQQDGKKYYTAEEINSAPTSALVKEAVIRPTQLLFTEPVVFSFTLWSAFAFGTVFMFTQSIYQVFHSRYGFTESEVGLVQSALVVGEIVGSLIICPVQDKLYLRSASGNVERLGHPIYEARLYLSIPATLLGLVAGYFLYGWSTNSSSHPLHWFVPTLALLLTGVSLSVIMQAAANYMTDSYGRYASSAVAAEAAGENVVAALLPLATMKMYDELGFGWASSLLGFVGVGLVAVPGVLIWIGKELRGRSRFMQSL